jgi:hypothetical protein
MKRMYKKIILPLLLLSLGTSYAQNVSDLIISEIMADGDSSVVDGYGRRNGWIEIFNKSHGSVNFGGCYLTDDRDNLKKSLIPKGDSRTIARPRQTALFYASGRGEDGTFYTNFEIRRGATVYLVSNDGRTIIDELKVPDNLPSGKSVAKIATDAKQMNFQVAPEPAVPSPGSRSNALDEESRSHKMAREDPYGWILTLVSVSVVFFSLTILWLLFNMLFQPKEKKIRKRSDKSGLTPEATAAISMALNMELGDEKYAAIALAIDRYLHETIHDRESFVLTIKPSVGSKWADKSLTFRKNPKR